MIGLLDYDLEVSTSTKLLIPNVEIMKLATYYRLEEKQFCRLMSLKEEEDLSKYDKIFFFSEIAEPPIIPDNFKRAQNVIYGGTAFTRKAYVPFKNEVIDYTIPRPTIYKEFLKQKYQEGIKTNIINHVLDDTFYRNYAGENKLPIPVVRPKKRVFLFDRDFFYPDWKETINQLTERCCSTIIRIHPIICHTLTDFFDARHFAKLNKANEYFLDINVSLEDMNYLLNHYKNKFLADIVPTSNIFIPIGGTKNTQLQYASDIIYKLNLAYFFWSEKIPIKIKYIKPEFGMTENSFSDLLQLIEFWGNSLTGRKDKTIMERIPKKKEYNNIREQAKQLIKLKPTADRLLNCSRELIINGGRWRV